MSNQAYETKTLFVTVKTYPNPSRKHIETTCVSGITDEGCWMRLHPVHFRLLEDSSQFQRYSWIRVRVNKAGAIEHVSNPKGTSRDKAGRFSPSALLFYTRLPPSILYSNSHTMVH